MKASTNVDWVISVGIFLTYVMFLFIILKPGVEEVYDESALFEIIRENIYAGAEHRINRTPLFLSEVIGCKRVQCFYDGWQDGHSGIKDENGAWISNIGGENADFYVAAGTNKVFFMDSNRESYDEGGCVCDGGCNIDCGVNPESCETECGLGPTEVKKGLHEGYLGGLIGNCYYDTLKEDWGIPNTMDFAIYADTDGVDGYEYECNAESYDNVDKTDVFVREWNDIFIDKSGDRIGEVVINVRIW